MRFCHDRRLSLKLTAMLSTLLIVCLMLVACGPKKQTTRMQLDDFNAAAAAMAQSLAASQWLRDRSSNSPPIIVTINKVQNLTDDIMTPAEQWMFIEKVRTTLPIQQLRETKNIHFQIPPEQQARLQADGFNLPPDTAPQPTHLMTAVFLSAPRVVRNREAQIDRRQDYYYMEYTVTDIATRKMVWSDTFEFKREARGLLID